MARTAMFVDRQELAARRARLLKRSRLSWEQLLARAENWELSDDEQDLFDTIRGIDRMLAALDAQWRRTKLGCWPLPRTSPAS